jgi:hypothetical protein
MENMENELSEETVRKLEQLINLKEIQIELVVNLAAAVMWIINYSNKTGLDIPNLENLQKLIHKLDKLMQFFYPEDSDK